jgi:DNA-directed RNA polymerase specialized sigma24 family protein
VYTTGFRLLQRHLRRSTRVDPALTEPLLPKTPSPEEATTTVMAVEAELAAMPPRRRACAVMCLVLGLSVHETGEALGIADGTVRKHLEEARRGLGGALG